MPFNFHAPVLEVLLRLLASVVLGGIVGWEREIQHKPAGLRTHMMVALGAAAFMLFALEMFQDLKASNPGAMDPTRIIEGLIGGIGFLCAGAIIQRGSTVEGMTTAAGIWVVGVVGAACGAGYYLISMVTTAFTFIILRFLGLLERRAFKAERPPPEET